MNAPVTAPAFAHKLPAREPTLADLAKAAIDAAEWLNICPDALWNAANEAEIAARNAFHDRLTTETGMPLPLFGKLAGEGLL